MNIHVLNRKEELVTILHNDTELGGVLAFNLIEDLAELDTLDFEVSSNVEGIEHLAEGNYILVQNLAGSWKQFVITRASDSHGVGISKSVECEECISELGDDDNLVEYSGKAIDLAATVKAILAGTRYTVGTITTPLIAPQLEKSTRYASKLAVLTQLADAAGLYLFLDIAVNASNVITKTVHLKAKNKEEGKRFEFDSDLGSIARTTDASGLKTAIRPLGAALEQTQAEVDANKPIEYVTIKDVAWHKSEGKPLDKAAGQEILIDPEATARYGVLGADGAMKPKVVVMQFDGITDPELLAVKAWAELEKISKPQVSYAFTATDLTQHMVKLGAGEKPVEVGDVCYTIDDSMQPPIVTEVLIRRIEGNPDQKDSMKVEIGIPETTLVDGVTGASSTGIGDSFGGGGVAIGDLIAIKASINDLKANKATITDLNATNAAITELKADVAKIATLEADIANLDKAVIGKADIANLSAVDAKITQLKADVAYVKDLEAAVARIGTLEVGKATVGDLAATNATVGTLTAEVAKIKTIEADIISVGKLVADKADVTALNAAVARVGTLESNKANITDLNAANANITTLLTHKATIETLIAGNISATNIKAGTITASSAIVASLSASKITTGTLDASKVTVSNLNAGSITAGTIDASKITVTNINASNINTGTLDASKVTVSNMNAGAITGGTIDAAKVTVLNLNASNISTGTINASTINITNLNATNITTGNLDANKVTIKNLRADSIVAGSITLQGENILHNTDFERGLDYYWVKDTVVPDGVIISPTIFHEGVKSIYVKTTNKSFGYKSKHIPATSSAYVGSIYVKTTGTFATNYLKCMVLAFDEAGTQTILEQALTTNGTTDWQRVVFDVVVPPATKTVAFKFRTNGNFEGWFAKPMLSKGTIASEWKLHTDELISDGAIDNDKLAGESVTSDKLVLDEIFASKAFVEKFEAVEIKAGQITTGKISSDYLDVDGIVSFAKNPKAFGADMVDNFIFDTTADKTFINGGALYANSVTAEKINAKGLAITNAGNAITFQVFDKLSADNSNGRYQEGDVRITGTLESTNYDPSANTGYRIDKDGNVDIYNATIRGDVVLPQAGITNFGQQIGNENILKESFLNKSTGDYLMCQLYLGSNKPAEGEMVTISIKGELFSGKTGFGIYNSGGNIQMAVVGHSHRDSEGIYRLSFPWKISTASNNYLSIYMLYSSVAGTSTVEWVKLEAGDKATPWCPNKEDAAALNPVRFWAGTDYSKREEAPFQVLQDGTIKATRGEFGGTFTGEVNIGNIRIADTNTSEASFTIHTNNFTKKVLEFNEREAIINSNFVLGDEANPSLQFDNIARTFNFKDSPVVIGGNKSKVSFPVLTPQVMVAEYAGDLGNYKVVNQWNAGAYEHIHNGVKATGKPDFEFKRAEGDTSVKVSGSVEVTNEIVLGAIKIVNKSQNGKKRIEFVVV